MGRYMMEPMVLARLIQVLQPQAEDKAMVVAAGRGYGAAILARLAKSVTAVETDASMAAAARQTLADLGLAAVELVVGQAEQGAAAGAPYDVILIEGAVREVPKAISDQLAEGGPLATVIADPSGALGVAHLYVKQGGGGVRAPALRRRFAAAAASRRQPVHLLSRIRHLPCSGLPMLFRLMLGVAYR